MKVREVRKKVITMTMKSKTLTIMKKSLVKPQTDYFKY